MDEGNSVVKEATEAAFRFLSKTGNANLGSTAMIEVVQDDTSATLEQSK